MLKRGLLTAVLIGTLLVQIIPVRASGCVVDHYVQYGETLSHIAYLYGDTVHDIQVRNHIINPNHIYAGSVVLVSVCNNTDNNTGIPNIHFHTVSYGETIYWIAAYYGVPMSDVIAHNPTINPHYIYVGQVINVPNGY